MKQRSMSDPNLLRHVEDDIGDFEPELAYLVDDEESPPTSPTTKHSSWSTLPGPTHPTLTSTASHPPPSSSLPLHQSTPVDKLLSIHSYLASIPIPQIDEGIGDNVCTSESGSGCSSPIMTPPDDNSSTLFRLARDIHDHRQKAWSEGMEPNGEMDFKEDEEEEEEKVEPCDVEMEECSQQPLSPTTVSNRDETDGTHLPVSSAATTPSASTAITMATVSQATSVGIPPKPLHPEIQASLLSNGIPAHQLPSSASSPSLHTLLAETRGSAGNTITMATHAQPSSGPPLGVPPPKSSVPEVRGGEAAGQRVSPPPPPLSSSGANSNRSATLPPSFANFSQPPPLRKTALISPNSSRSSLSSLGLSFGVQPDGLVSRADTVSPILERESPIESRDLEDFDSSQSDSPLSSASGVDRLSQHRRSKSDSGGDHQGPVKTAQIYSVPERVKEIEEMNSADPSQPERGGKESPTSPPPASVSPTGAKKSSSLCTASSEESIPSRPLSLASSSHEDNKEEVHLPVKFSASPCLATRHSSLSPSPKPVVVRSLTPHLPLHSATSLPPSSSSAAHPLCLPEAEFQSEEELTSSLQGVVKAKVQHIEGKSKDSLLEPMAKSRKIPLFGPDQNKHSAFRRPSLPLPYFPTSTANPGDSRTDDPPIDFTTFRPSHKSSSSDTTSAAARPSSVAETTTIEGTRRRRREEEEEDVEVMATRTHHRNLHFKSSAMKFKSEADIPRKLIPVQELKRKFEVRPEIREYNGKPKQRLAVNLRRAHSMKEMEYPRRRYSSYTPRSKITLLRMDSCRSSSISPPHTEYITTIPSERVIPDVDDFQTALSKFSKMESSGPATDYD